MLGCLFGAVIDVLSRPCSLDVPTGAVCISISQGYQWKYPLLSGKVPMVWGVAQKSHAACCFLTSNHVVSAAAATLVANDICLVAFACTLVAEAHRGFENEG